MNPETYTDVLQQNPEMPDELKGHVSRLAMEAGEPGYVPRHGHTSTAADVWPGTVEAQLGHEKPVGRHASATSREPNDALLSKTSAYEGYAQHSLNNIVNGVRAFADGTFSFIEESNSSSYKSWEDMAAAALGYIHSAPTHEERRNGLSQFIHGVNYLWEGSYSSSEAVQDQTTVYTITALQALRFDDVLMPELQGVYFDKSDETSKALRNMLVQLQGRTADFSDGDEWYSMAFLGRMYDEDFIDLYKRATHLRDPTLIELFAAEGAKRHIIKTEIDKHTDADYLKHFTAPEASNIQRGVAQRLLREIAPSLPREAAQDLLFAADSRTEPADSNDHRERANSLRDLLIQTIETTDKLGRTAVERLRRHAGIVNFDYYETNQLEMMNKVIEYDEETLEYLSQGDLTVVFIDALGDYNGAFKTASSNFRKPSGRTLFFEIHEPEDYDRYKAFLKIRDLKPSTVVLGQHGMPGAFALGRQRKESRWRVVEEETGKVIKGKKETKEVAVEVDEIKRPYIVTNEPKITKGGPWGYQVASILQVVGDLKLYMQPSRGIDDPLEATGSMQFVLSSCSMDVPVAQTAIAPGREPVTETVAKAVGPGVVVAGGNMPMAMLGTQKGIKMDGFELQPDGSYKNIGTIPISVIYIGTDGNLNRDQVDELILHQ